VRDYLSRFTLWRAYEHRVLARVGEQLVPVPINRTTLNRLYDLELADDDAATRFLAAAAEPAPRLDTSEDAVVSKVGRDLYERMFRGYTRKQWGLDPSQLDASVCARIPVRTSEDDRYFTDAFQQMPAHGYTPMFEQMLDHPRIEVRTATAFDDVRASLRFRRLVWTGPIDAYFDYRLGRLPYRSLEFAFETHATPPGTLLQPVAQLNFPGEDVPYTRITEFRHLTGEDGPLSTLAYEYPRATGEPYYPIPRGENRALYERYRALASAERDVTFVGRLARYQYLNMDQVVAQALLAARRAFGVRHVAPRRRRPTRAIPARKVRGG
jgi:UDP-galactopyranose mutase